MKHPKPLKKLKKPKLPGKVAGQLGDSRAAKAPRRLANKLRRKKTPEQKVSDALSNVPRITNETVADHREEVLSSARKFIYPLQHSKHRIVKISVALLIAVAVTFFAMVSLQLYKFQSTSGFIYDVTRVIPFPVAKAGSSWISYESYLFELRRNMHYYEKQQQTDFSTQEGQEQLKRLKKQAMDQVVRDAYVKQLAAKNDVSVSNQAVDNQVALVRRENRLGSSERVFREVLNEFWGWSEADFKRALKQQMLQQSVIAKLDKPTNERAQAALKRVKEGQDFAGVAGQVSEDPITRATGGEYPRPLTPSDRDIPPALSAVIFSLKAGQISDLVNSGYTLDIAKVLEITDSTRRAAHIQFNFQDVNVFVKPLQASDPSRQFIKI